MPAIDREARRRGAGAPPGGPAGRSKRRRPRQLPRRPGILDFAFELAAAAAVAPIAIELSGLDIAVVLRGLASIEHSIVAHDSYAAYPCGLWRLGPLFKLLGGAVV